MLMTSVVLLPVKFSGIQGTGCPPVPVIQCVLAQVVVFPGSHHISAHGVQVVTVVFVT